MRVTGVIVRFLSMLDVVIVMLGILLLALAQSEIRKAGKKSASGADATTVKDALDGRFVYLFAGVKDAERGKVYQLGGDGKRLREIRTNSPEDVQDVLKATAGGKEMKDRERIVLLIIGTGAFDSMWSAKRFSDMESAWGLKVVPVYNVDLDRPAK